MVNPDTPLPDWLKAQYPFAPKNFRTATGDRLSYLDEGPRSDEAVLMLHGNPTWSFYYRRLVRLLSPTLRCIVPDHVGMGLSDKPQDHPYTLESRIRDVEDLVASLGIRKLHLIVHDWGGAIGMGLATRDPSRIGRIVILNTGAFHLPRIPRRIALCRNHPFGTLLVRGLNGFAWPATWMSLSRRSLSRDEKRAFLFPHGNWHDRVAVNAFVKDIPMELDHVTRPELDRIERELPKLSGKEVLLLWGGRDFCFTRHFHDRFRQLLPNSRSVYLHDAGHYILEDAPEEAAAQVGSFLGL